MVRINFSQTQDKLIFNRYFQTKIINIGYFLGTLISQFITWSPILSDELYKE